MNHSKDYVTSITSTAISATSTVAAATVFAPDVDVGVPADDDEGVNVELGNVVVVVGDGEGVCVREEGLVGSGSVSGGEVGVGSGSVCGRVDCGSSEICYNSVWLVQLP